MTKQAMVPLAAVRAMLDVMEEYIHPKSERYAARCAALAVGIGYAEPKAPTPKVNDDQAQHAHARNGNAQ